VAYETGTWLNPSDGLDKIRVFLIAQGWTVDSFAVEAPGKRLHMHKGTFYLNAKSSDGTSEYIWGANSFTPVPQIGFNIGTGYNAITSWRDQPGVVKDSGGIPIGAPIALPAGAVVGYRLDYDDLYKSLVIYVQITVGIWRWVAFGENLIKAGVWTGGAWLAASQNYYWVGNSTGPGYGSTENPWPIGANSDNHVSLTTLLYVRADVDAYLSKWVSCSAYNLTGKMGDTNLAGGTATQPEVPGLTGLQVRARNALNSLSDLLPVQLFAARDAGGISLLGTLPNIYATNITGMVPGQSYQQGVDWFTPFPGDVPTRGTVIKRV